MSANDSCMADSICVRISDASLGINDVAHMAEGLKISPKKREDCAQMDGQTNASGNLRAVICFQYLRMRTDGRRIMEMYLKKGPKSVRHESHALCGHTSVDLHERLNRMVNDLPIQRTLSSPYRQPSIKGRVSTRCCAMSSTYSSVNCASSAVCARLAVCNCCTSHARKMPWSTSPSL